MKNFGKSFLIVPVICGLFISSCEKSTKDDTPLPPPEVIRPVFLLIDEQSISEGNVPNQFSSVDINKSMADVGYRTQLRYFRDRPGQEVELYTGEVGNEGWFAIKSIPLSWKNAGPTDKGAMNFFEAGPGLGENGDASLLSEVPDIIPLRARGLKMLEGRIVIAIVFNGNIPVDYDPIRANLQGETLGVVAFQVISTRKRTDGIENALPVVKLKILNSDNLISEGLYLFTNTPSIHSASDPHDIDPPDDVGEPDLIPAG